jgi:hypothetical protein
MSVFTAAEIEYMTTHRLLGRFATRTTRGLTRFETWLDHWMSSTTQTCRHALVLGGAKTA